ncbi:MAG: DUF2017 domain-containing protein [Cryobacterium sp.]|nr:DUF2017 domain-containing protein [Cryobacterium sp.]MBX3117332.1 DUF2017 domain-containing protein [Cryobacterium sp.]MCO5294335.1 DUF2017 domain-containing protein [Homoserinimonas sp.]
MKGFSRDRSGKLRASIDRDEALLLQSLAGQLIDLLQHGRAADTAIQRLFPDVYPDDEAASAEFKRLTLGGLRDRKILNAESIMSSLSAAVETGELELDGDQIQSWLRGLTDIRLTLADRLGIVSDDQEPLDGEPMQGLYDWLGFLQNSLVEALDSSPRGRQ